jgi:CheY-like chemotaxis protein/HPt (histidine-containing phosphotransfer) domain-containing protein
MKVAKGELQHRPTIIMVTAYSKEQLLKEAANTSDCLDAVLTKPVAPSALLNTIIHAYRRLGCDHRILETHINPYEAARPLRNARILLVEDNELNQQVISEFLEKAGLHLSIANHGSEAVQWVEHNDFDAVLMDLQMPGMDGYEATWRIRELPACRELPIIAMTASVIPLNREAILAAGMNDSVAKPINPLELINTLLRWIKHTDDTRILPSPAPLSRESGADLGDRLPGFELTNILELLNGNQEKLVSMLGRFKEQFSGDTAALVSKIKAGELVAAEKQLHKLKGAAGNLGAQELHQICAVLDAQLVNGHYDAETLAQWIETFDRTMMTISDMLSRQLSVTFSDMSADVTSQQILAQLDDLLTKDSFISNELLARLKLLLPDDRQVDYENLVQHILDTDYPKARSVLNSLMRLPNEKS